MNNGLKIVLGFIILSAIGLAFQYKLAYDYDKKIEQQESFERAQIELFAQSKIKQLNDTGFYENYSFTGNKSLLYWGHQPISILINDSCKVLEKRRVQLAALEIMNKTSVKFAEFRNYTLENEQGTNILITCLPNKSEDYYNIFKRNNTAALTQIFVTDPQLDEANIIIFGINTTETVIERGLYPSTEVHELLHALGFEHNSNNESIMFTKTTNYVRQIDKPLIEAINIIYEGDSNG